MADHAREPTRGAPQRWSLVAAIRRLFRTRRDATASRSYRFLARQIAADLPRTERGVIMLLSAAAPAASSNEMMLLLAHALREELASRVLLLDGTFGADGVAAMLGQSRRPGLTDWLAGRSRSLSDLVLGTAHPGVSLLPGGSGTVPAGSVFLPSAVPDLYNELGARFDHVLVQQGSILDDTRYLAFAERADLVLLLIEEGVTRVGEVDRALEVFRDHHVGQVRLMLCEPG